MYSLMSSTIKLLINSEKKLMAIENRKRDFTGLTAFQCFLMITQQRRPIGTSNIVFRIEKILFHWPI